MGQNEPIRKSAHPSGATVSEIPDKLYFRIGEVARLCEVPTYVLRFWESEFPQLKPNKGGTGQRLYRRRDVEMALRVKSLLKQEGYTIPGARQVLKAEFKHKEPQLPLLSEVPDARQLRGLRRELQAILAMLARPAGKASGAAGSVAVTKPIGQPVQPIRTPRRTRASASEFPFDDPQHH